MNRTQRIVAYIAAVVVGTAVVILVVAWISQSWAVSAAAGVISGVLSAAMYPVLFRTRS
jgi:hypothetical protein